MGVIFRKWILIRCNDVPARGIVVVRQLFEWNKTLPIAVARGTVRGDVAAAVLGPDREKAGRMIADVAVDIGIDEVLAGTGESRDGGGELGPVSGVIQLEERELEAFCGG